MRRIISLLLAVVLLSSLLLTSCSGVSEPSATKSASETQSPSNSAQPAKTDSPVATMAPTTPPTPTPETGPAKVVLTNSADSTGNSHFASAHYGLHIAYTGEYVTLMNYMTMLKHGDDIYGLPAALENFEYQAEDLQYYNGLLYFLLYDWDNGVYYLYSYDLDNEPVKVGSSSVYHYEFINGKIYFTKDFVQGPIFAMDANGGSEIQITSMRAHSFVSDGQALYFYATDAGTAPGLVKYNLATNEETTIVFPFFSHNYMVHGGYLYYVNEGSTYRSIHRMSLADQSVTDIWVEMTDYVITLNISDGMLYILAGNSVYKSGLDGSGRVKILIADDNLNSGLYIFGSRAYCSDENFVYCTLTDGSEVSVFSLNALQ